MGKKNRKPTRTQFQDMADDGTIERSPYSGYLDEPKPKTTFAESDFEDVVKKPSYQPAKLKPEDAGIYREGTVVTCENTSKLRPEPVVTGTIVQLCAGEAWVVDERGLMHKVPLSKLYIAQ